MTRGPLVHFSPHPDDWIFFWGERAAAALEDGRPATFIHLTAGDAGRDDGWWQAREAAALAAMGLEGTTAKSVTMRGHAIATRERGPIVAHFLRLPDGMPDGRGSARRDASLSRLRDEGRPLPAIDGSTSYATWDDLVETIAAVVAAAGTGATLCATEYRRDRNPEDHADHIATADLVLALGSGHPREWFLTYCAYYLPGGEGPPGAAKARAWAAHRAVLADHLGDGPRLAALDGEWLAWGGHEHVRAVGAGKPEPVGGATPWLAWPERIADDGRHRAVAPVGVRPQGDGLLLVHPLSGAELRLDGAAATLWELLHQPMSVEELAEVLAEALPDTPAEAHRTACRTLIATLVSHRFVVPAAARLPD